MFNDTNLETASLIFFGVTMLVNIVANQINRVRMAEALLEKAEATYCDKCHRATDALHLKKVESYSYEPVLSLPRPYLQQTDSVFFCPSCAPAWDFEVYNHEYRIWDYFKKPSPKTNVSKPYGMDWETVSTQNKGQLDV